jgi:hypothetical protein
MLSNCSHLVSDLSSCQLAATLVWSARAVVDLKWALVDPVRAQAPWVVELNPAVTASSPDLDY